MWGFCFISFPKSKRTETNTAKYFFLADGGKMDVIVTIFSMFFCLFHNCKYVFFSKNK